MNKRELMWIAIIFCIFGAIALFILDKLAGALALVVLAHVLHDLEERES